MPIKIARWARWLAGFVGMAGLAAGGTATFTRDVEAGPVALLAVGALFLIIALAGVLPTRVKFGDNEAEFTAAAEALAEVVDDTPVDSRAELLTTINRLAQSAPDLVAPALSGLAYEAVVLDMLKSIAEIDPDIALVAPERAADVQFDALVISPTQVRLGIEIKAVRTVSTKTIERIHHQLGWMRERFGVQRMLVVFREPPAPGALAMFFRYPDLSPVVIKGVEETDLLRTAIRNALGLDGAGG